jgi:hypothetical protein
VVPPLVAATIFIYMNYTLAQQIYR